MDGVKMAFGNRGMTVEAAPQYPGTYVTDCVSRGHFFLANVFFRTALPCSGGYHMEKGGMPLHDAVGINFKKGATTENQGSGVTYMD